MIMLILFYINFVNYIIYLSFFTLVTFTLAAVLMWQHIRRVAEYSGYVLPPCQQV